MDRYHYTEVKLIEDPNRDPYYEYYEEHFYINGVNYYNREKTCKKLHIDYEDLAKRFNDCLYPKFGIREFTHQMLFALSTMASINIGTTFNEGMTLMELLFYSFIPVYERLKRYEWLTEDAHCLLDEFDTIYTFIKAKRPRQEDVNDYIQIIYELYKIPSNNNPWYRDEQIKEGTNSFFQKLEQIAEAGFYDDYRNFIKEIPLLCEKTDYVAKYSIDKLGYNHTKIGERFGRYDMRENGDSTKRWPEWENAILFTPEILVCSMLNLLIIYPHQEIWRAFGKNEGGRSGFLSPCWG